MEELGREAGRHRLLRPTGLSFSRGSREGRIGFSILRGHGMGESFQVQLAALENEVRAAAIPDSCKQTAAWCFGQLPALYDNLRLTSESRYADEITRLVRWVLKELAKSKPPCPAAQQLAVRITDRLHLLHEQFGLPRLELKLASASLPRSRKAS